MKVFVFSVLENKCCRYTSFKFIRTLAQFQTRFLEVFESFSVRLSPGSVDCHQIIVLNVVFLCGDFKLSAPQKHPFVCCFTTAYLGSSSVPEAGGCLAPPVHQGPAGTTRWCRLEWRSTGSRLHSLAKALGLHWHSL